MALNVAGLQAQILQILSTPIGKTTPAQAAAEWTAAYDSYARAGTDASLDPVLSVKPPAFRAALKFVNRSGTPLTAALEFERAFIGYWTGGLFAVGLPPTPAVIPPSAPPVAWQNEIVSVVIAAVPGLASLLVPIFTDNANQDLNSRARQFANAFHTATTTMVTVQISGLTVPMPTPLPIIHIGLVQ